MTNKGTVARNLTQEQRDFLGNLIKLSQLLSVSHISKVWGVSRDTLYEYKKGVK